MASPLRTVIGITGASGSLYGFRLAQVLVQKGYPIYLIATHAARTVARHEMGFNLEAVSASEGRTRSPQKGPGPSHLQLPEVLVKYFGKGSRFVTWLDPMEMEAPVSSGSHKTRGMVVIPCSMGRLPESPTGQAAIWWSGQQT